MKQTTSQTPDYIARIQLRYPSMCGAEQKLADFFLTRDRSLPVEDSVKRLGALPLSFVSVRSLAILDMQNSN